VRSWYAPDLWTSLCFVRRDIIASVPITHVKSDNYRVSCERNSSLFRYGSGIFVETCGSPASHPANVPWRRKSPSERTSRPYLRHVSHLSDQSATYEFFPRCRTGNVPSSYEDAKSPSDDFLVIKRCPRDLPPRRPFFRRCSVSRTITIYRTHHLESSAGIQQVVGLGRQNSVRILRPGHKGALSAFSYWSI
jgi:hypothetical protein